MLPITFMEALVLNKFMCILLSLGALLTTAPAWALDSTPWAEAWVADGEVKAAVAVGNTLYLGGDFGFVGPPTGSFAAWDLGAGALASTAWQRVVGTITAIAPDGAGGWYVGGGLTRVGDTPVSNLAHILPGGVLDLTWAGTTDGVVEDVVLVDDTLYISGGFTQVNGEARGYIAALDAATGALLPWAPESDADIYGIDVTADTVYCAGDFSNIGGAARTSFAAVSRSTGLATDWVTPVGNDGGWRIVAGEDVVYVSGFFGDIAGEIRPSGVAAFDKETGALASWNPFGTGSGYVNDLLLDTGVVYLAGTFSDVGGQPRSHLAAADAVTGAVTSWDPNVTGFSSSVNSICADGGTIYFSGRFDAVGTGPAKVSRENFGAVDRVTGLDASVALPSASEGDSANAMAVQAGVLYMGGRFSSVAGRRVARLAALDLTTGGIAEGVTVPYFQGSVKALASDGTNVYVGGGYGSYSADPSFAVTVERGGIAAFSVATGALVPGVPDLDGFQGDVEALAVDGNTLYLGGKLGVFGGEGRQFLASMDTSTSTVNAWNPQMNLTIFENDVYDIAVDSAGIFVAGNFNGFDVVGSVDFGLLKATNGTSTGWNAAPVKLNDLQGGYAVLPVPGGGVYVGGVFSEVGGQPRSGVALLDKTTALATTFDAGVVNGFARGLALVDSTLYMGGEFDLVGGATRLGGAALNPVTGALQSWNPAFDVNPNSGVANVKVLLEGGGSLVAGGRFDLVGGQSRPNLAIFKAGSAVPPVLLGVEPLSELMPGGDVPLFVNFSEPVGGFTDSSVLLSIAPGDTITYDSITVTGGPSAYLVTLNNMAGEGTFLVSVDPLGIIDRDAVSLVSGGDSPFIYLDTTAPVIDAVAPISVNCGESYTDVPPSASDLHDGPTLVVTSGAVDTIVPGDYTLTYTATDLVGNVAQTSRVVTVLDNCPEGEGQVVDYDFGDAPDPAYPTLLASSGPQHALDGVTHLGAGASAEADGQPTAGADGDNDDGVTFNGTFAVGETVVTTITATPGAFLSVWIDYDGDGDFTGQEETLITGFQIAASPLVFPYKVPPATIASASGIVRFRLGTTPVTLPTGLAGGFGEVEDYRVEFPPCTSLSGNLMVNGGFENAINGWDGLTISTASLETNNVYEGTHALGLGMNNENGLVRVVSQEVLLPVGESAELSGQVRLFAEDFINGQVRILVDGTELAALNKSELSSTVFTQIAADLSDYADGETHTVGFEFSVDNEFVNYILDAVVLTVCESAADGEGEGEGIVEGDGEGVAEGEGEGLVEGGGEGVVEGEGEGVTEGEGEGGVEGEGEGEGVAEGEGEGVNEGEGEGQMSDPYEQLLYTFASADVDGNSRVTLPEILVQLPQFTQQDFDAADANGDESLSVAELLALSSAQVILSADTSGDYVVSLSELLRAVQLYNDGGYACAANPGATEDGYLPSETPGLPACVLHGLDRNGDNQISLSELLRGIQLFSFVGYNYCDGQSEDNFCDRP